MCDEEIEYACDSVFIYEKNIIEYGTEILKRRGTQLKLALSEVDFDKIFLDRLSNEDFFHN